MYFIVGTDRGTATSVGITSGKTFRLIRLRGGWGKEISLGGRDNAKVLKKIKRPPGKGGEDSF